MIIKFDFNKTAWEADLNKPIDISIPLIPNQEGVNCFYAPQCTAEPVRAGNFVGSIAEGGLVNFKNIMINPHGNGTHTECVEHISPQETSINKSLSRYHFIGQLITVDPKESGADKVVGLGIIKKKFDPEKQTEAVIIRTNPNDKEKLKKNYSGTNPPYLDPKGITYLKESGVKHLLIDLPSVDREEDDGKLLAHKAFWNVPEEPEKKHTITELIYVPNEIKDGLYLVNIHITSLESDASPSKVVLYEMNKANKYL